MAIFSSKKEEKKEVSAPKAALSSTASGKFAGVLLQPRVTEKATIKSEQGVYTFDISLRSTKGDVIKAIKEYYNVTPVKVAITKYPPKKVVYRGKPGVKSGGKKAYVYLKKGETIEFI